MTRLIRWSPFIEEPFAEFHRLFGENAQAMSTTGKGFVPAVDIYQTKDAVVVETPLPGVDPAKVDVAIENDVLTIKGEHEQKTEVDEKEYYRKEVRIGSFFRSVTLPAHVVSDAATATYEKGLLKITIPKAPEVKAKSIKVEVSGK